jgi:putative ABC transport system permease protein
MKSVIRNFIYVLRRFKTATILNIIGLSVAFASFMIIMMQVDYDSSFDKGIADNDRIYRVEVVHEDGSGQAVMVRPIANLLFQSSPHIEAGTVTNYGIEDLFLKISGGSDTKTGFLEKAFKVTSSYTDVFHFDMLEGSDKALSEPNQVLIPESVAKRLFAGESALNKPIEFENSAMYYAVDGIYTVGGVYKDFPKNSSVSNVIYYKMPDDENLNHWGNSNYMVFIRVTSSDAVAGLLDNFKKYAEKELDDDWKNVKFQFTQLPEIHFTTGIIYDSAPKASRQTIAILFAIAFVIVIIAAVNFTNFSMALTPARIRSINTQKVLGATTSELRKVLLIEAICTSMIAFLLSLVLIELAGYTPVTELVNADIALSEHVLLVSLTAVLSIVIGIVAGVYPAFYMTSFPPALVLKGSFGLSDKGRQMRSILIGFQFVASMALIMSAGLMYLQNQFMQNSPLGYDKEALIIAITNTKLNQEWKLFKTKMESYSEISDVTNSMMLLSSGDQYMGWGRTYKEKPISFQCLPVEYSFLDAMHIKLTGGRNFRESDIDSRHGVLIFNEKAKKQFNIDLNTMIDSMEVIGFVPDIKFASFRTEIDPMAFYIGRYAPWFNYVYIKTKKGANPYAAMDHVKNTLNTVDAGFPFKVYFFDDVFNRTYEKEQNLSKLITTFSLIAILISIVGVFGLVIFESEYRRREISVRKVLGSSVKEILLLFNKTYIKILAVCFAIAMPIAYYVINRWLENFAYKTPVHW